MGTENARLTPKGIALMEEVDRRCKERGITDIWEQLDVIDEVMREMKTTPSPEEFSQ